MSTELNPPPIEKTAPVQSASPPRGYESGGETVESIQRAGCAADIAPSRETLRNYFDTALAEIAALRSLEPEHSGYARQTQDCVFGLHPVRLTAS